MTHSLFMLLFLLTICSVNMCYSSHHCQLESSHCFSCFWVMEFVAPFSCRWFLRRLVCFLFCPSNVPMWHYTKFAYPTLLLTEYEQSSQICAVCPLSSLPSLPPTLLLILIEVEKIQNKSDVHLKRMCFAAGSHSFPLVP